MENEVAPKSKIEFLVECEDCKHHFQISSDEKVGIKVNHKKEFCVDDDVVYLTYYDCPKCHRRHIVQIDDELSLKELKDVSDMFTRLFILKKKNGNVSKKQSAKYKKAIKHLSETRRNLMTKYSGKIVYDPETDSDVELKFSI